MDAGANTVIGGTAAQVAGKRLIDVTVANTEPIPLHTVYVSNDDEGITFMQELAALNGGTCRVVE